MTFFFNFSLSLIAIQALSLLPSTIASPQFHGVKDDLVSRQSTDCVNSATDRACWGEYDLSTNYYDVVPDTGVTREVSVQMPFHLAAMPLHDNAGYGILTHYT